MAGMATRIATGTVATVVTASMPFQLYVVQGRRSLVSLEAIVVVDRLT